MLTAALFVAALVSAPATDFSLDLDLRLSPAAASRLAELGERVLVWVDLQDDETGTELTVIERKVDGRSGRYNLSFNRPRRNGHRFGGGSVNVASARERVRDNLLRCYAEEIILDTMPDSIEMHCTLLGE